jgi:hypothetical protein
VYDVIENTAAAAAAAAAAADVFDFDFVRGFRPATFRGKK